MNELSAFTIVLDRGQVHVAGSARYDRVQRPIGKGKDLHDMAFEWTFHQPTDLWAFSDMLSTPHGSPLAMRIEGRIDLNGVCLPIGAIRVIGRKWPTDPNTTQICTLVESWGPDATDDDLHDGYAAAFLSLAPADRTWMIDEVRRACQDVPHASED